MAAAGGAFRLVQQRPGRIGVEMPLTGRHMTIGLALELGLVNAVVPDDRTRRDRNRRENQALLETGDAREGPLAFVEKRVLDVKGRWGL